MTFQEAVAAHRAGDLAAAEAGYRAALPKRNAFHNLASLLAETGRAAEAEPLLRAILRQFPDDAPARHSLGMILLADGRFEEGWRLYEGRRWTPQSNTIDPASLWPDLPPEWDGGDLGGGRLLVVGEQGFGDQLMFGRYLAQLPQRGVTLAPLLSPELLPLFPGAEVPRRRRPQADSWVLIGSLPYRLGLSGPPPPPAALAASAWSGGGGIGVVTSGRPSHTNDRNRSLDAGAAAALRALGRDLSPAATGAKDFGDTAEIIAGLDLVITVDTSVAHLAGSLGAPVWILLPAIGVDWRWMHDRSDSPWYPSARLFRQRTPGDWTAVLDDLRKALGEQGLA
jgi:tetratricopeptide (TPR) repeat protein